MRAAQSKKRREEESKKRISKSRVTGKRNNEPVSEPLYVDNYLPIANPAKFRVPGWVLDEDTLLNASQIVKRVYKNGKSFIGYLKPYDDSYGQPPPPRLVSFDPEEHELVDLGPLYDEKRRAINQAIKNRNDEEREIREDENREAKRKANRGMLGYIGNCVGSLCKRRHRAGKRATRKHTIYAL